MAESSDLSEWPRSTDAKERRRRRQMSGTATGNDNKKVNINADVVELVDSVDLGSSVLDVQVRVLSSAPSKGYKKDIATEKL